tara:strand:- start:94 stop:2160 length:2067 start_codon:yes stop_codon:yes gene_type:complete
MFKRALFFLIIIIGISSCKKNSTSTNQDLETYNLKIQILEDYTFSNPINSIHPVSPSLKLKAPFDGRIFTVSNGGFSKEFSYEDSLVAPDGGFNIEWEGTNSPITITIPPTSRTEEGKVVFSENLEEGKEYSINPLVQVSKIDTAAFILKFTSANGEDDLIQSAHIQKNEEWIPMLKEASCLDEINEQHQTNYSFFAELSDLNLDETLTLKLTNTFGEEQLAEITTAVLPFGRFTVHNVLEKASSNDCSTDSLLVNSLEIDLDELSFAPFYTYNFKVRIFDKYIYKNPVNTNLRQISTPLLVKSSFDGRSFSISDSSRQQDFVYGPPSPIWEGDSFLEEGIRVEWPSNSEDFDITLKINKTENFEELIQKQNIKKGQFNNNVGIGATVEAKKIDLAAFVIRIPDFLDSRITEGIDGFDFYSNGVWKPMLNESDCLNEIYTSSGEPYPAFIMLNDLPLDTTLTFRINNINGLSYEFTRKMGIAPFNSQEVSHPDRCFDWELFINVINIPREEIENDYVNNTLLPRTENYFPLPTIGDSLKFIHTRNEELAGTIEYDFYLVPLSISTSPDTTITYERHITWIPSGFGGSRLDSADIDTVTLIVKNKQFESLDFFPEVGATANDFYTYYPSDFENPHTETIYIEPNNGQPPFNSTSITLSKERGIIRITRFIQYSYNSSGRLSYTYTLQEN